MLWQWQDSYPMSVGSLTQCLSQQNYLPTPRSVGDWSTDCQLIADWSKALYAANHLRLVNDQSVSGLGLIWYWFETNRPLIGGWLTISWSVNKDWLGTDLQLICKPVTCSSPTSPQLLTDWSPTNCWAIANQLPTSWWLSDNYSLIDTIAIFPPTSSTWSEIGCSCM